MVSNEFGFQQTPQPDVYAVDTKFPTPEQVVANHDKLLVMLSGLKNGDGSPSNPPEFLAGFFGYTVDHVNNLIAEATNPTLQETSILSPAANSLVALEASEPRVVVSAQASTEEKAVEPIIGDSSKLEAVKKERELIPGERAYLLGLAHGEYPAKLVEDSKGRRIVVKTESRLEAGRKYLRDTVGTEGEMVEGLDSLRIILDPAKFAFMVDPVIKQDLLLRSERFAPILLGLIHSRSVGKEGRLAHPDRKLLERFVDFYPLHFNREIGAVKDRKGHSPFIQIKDLDSVYRDLFRVFSVGQIPFVKNLPGYVEEK